MHTYNIILTYMYTYILWHHKGPGSGGTLHSHSSTAATCQNGRSVGNYSSQTASPLTSCRSLGQLIEEELGSLRGDRGERKEGRSWTSQEWKGLQDEDEPKRTTQRRTLLSGLCLKISFCLKNLFLPRDAFC